LDSKFRKGRFVIRERSVRRMWILRCDWWRWGGGIYGREIKIIAEKV
jgi:hypothetical protein